jgi:glycosyltransferase involved in cell wall biosynthesis
MESQLKKNVVLLIPQLRHGGAERVVSRLSFLLNEDFNLKIVVFDKSIVTYEIGCDLNSLEVPSSVDNNLILKVINVFKRTLKYKRYKSENNIDITYSFGDTANIINIFSKGKDIKIVSIRGYKRVRMGKSIIERLFLKPISVYICKKADKVISVSRLITQTLISEYNLKSNKVITINNGFDVANIKKLSNESLNDDEFEFFRDNNVVITAGTFRPEKGYWHLLKAFSIVSKRDATLKLVILGTDYQDNKQKAIELSRKLNIDKSVIFLGYKENPYKYISRSKIYVLSSIFEGFPNALVEAMSCGLPVVAADCPSGPREILSPKSNLFEEIKGVKMSDYGVLVEKMHIYENYDYEDIQECDFKLAEGIIKILDVEVYKKYASKSLERAEEFNYKTWLSKQKEALLLK